MTHLDEVIARVNAAIAENIITHMNTLLVDLGSDADLSPDERFAQQQRLRIAIVHHGHALQEEPEAGSK